ncbi:MAG TPA: hypothetical protein VMJ93_16525 [Verrucomicrobiae bacterium]|nr:hypothetical protein [Verrucomicrobiae bacterium]
MNWLRRAPIYFLACSLGCLALPSSARPSAAPATAQAAGQNANAPRDGQHDFDFNLGTWNTHIRRLLHPLSGSNAWVEMNGTVSVRKVWNGRAQLEEIEAGGPAGHFEGLTLFLYNPESRQWSLNFANSNDGVLETPSIGEFKNGRGEFYDQETYQGRAILVRVVWSDITPKSHRFEQSFSDDGGKTWEPNFVANLTRKSDVAEPVEAPPAGKEPGRHDFDFEEGSWKIHLSRLVHPLTGSTDWEQFDGTTVTQEVWAGKAFLEQFEADAPSGHIEGLTLRLFNPQSRQWSLYWASSRTGTVGEPTIGEFKNGRGECYDQEPFNGRVIFVRYIWSDITSNSAHFEQSFSEDGGKTWEVNWITDQTRIKDAPGQAH